MIINEQKLKKALTDGNYLDKKDIDGAEKFAHSRHVQLSEYLLSEGLITKALLGQAWGEYLGVAYADFSINFPSSDLIRKVPESVAKKYRVVLYKEDDDQIIVATDDPSRKEIIRKIRKVLKKKVILSYAFPEDINAALAAYRKSLITRFASILKKKERVAPEIIDEIFEDASAFRASDIHFEPQEKDVIVRFRIDGVLHEAGVIPKRYYENILNRIKVQARLRIDQHFAAQDGAIRYIKEGQKENKVMDMRVSIVPTLDGEKIAIRLLSEYIRSFTLSDLGLNNDHQRLLEEMSQKPFGMILVVGPTGSGKTTTLYALLKLLNHPEDNLMTIEDPVEFRIAGVNQIQVNAETNLTFANGLRSIVRQDPDVILVGEIRDEETASIGVNAALTGHLLLSTFHANDAATAIPRLIDMKVEPFLLSSTLEVVIAQRLVRKICRHCKYSYLATKENIGAISSSVRKLITDKTTLYKGKGCESCSQTGYSGRTAIFEFIVITPEMADLILKNPSTRQIQSLARRQGSITLFEDGIEKVKTGVTTVEELLRIVSPPPGNDPYVQRKK